MECYLNETKISQRSSQRIWICKPLKETLRRLGNCFKILEGRIRLSIVAQFSGHFQRFGQVLNSTSGGHLHWQPTLGALSCSGRGPRLLDWVAENNKLQRELPFFTIPQVPQIKSSMANNSQCCSPAGRATKFEEEMTKYNV